MNSAPDGAQKFYFLSKFDVVNLLSTDSAILTALDKSSEFPALLYILTSRALIFPFTAKPT